MEQDYLRVVTTFAKKWVEEYQKKFIEKFIGKENFNKWADGNQKSCGKPLIFTKAINNLKLKRKREENPQNPNEINKYLEILDNNYLIERKTIMSYEQEQDQEQEYVNVYNEDINIYPVTYRNEKYYTNITFLEDEVGIDYEGRYIDLNLEPIKQIEGSNDMELHVEFRSLINFVKDGGGVNDFIIEQYPSLNTKESIALYLKDFANEVNTFLTECTKDIYENDYIKNPFNSENIRFGIELETCTNIKKINDVYNLNKDLNLTLIT